MQSYVVADDGICKIESADDFFKRYNTTFDEFVKLPGPYPNGFVDAKDYMAHIEKIERSISTAKSNVKFLKSKPNMAASLAHIQSLEAGIVSDSKALYNYVNTVRPIDGEMFKMRFNAFLYEKLDVKLEEVKALAKECLEGEWTGKEYDDIEGPHALSDCW